MMMMCKGMVSLLQPAATICLSNVWPINGATCDEVQRDGLSFVGCHFDGSSLLCYGQQQVQAKWFGGGGFAQGPAVFS